ncbi:MAG: hypothetical protein ABIO40_06315 [Devosia sp.]
MRQLLAVMHIEDVARGHVNLKRRQGDPLDIYLRNAVTLTQSLRVWGWGLTVMSDAPEVLIKRAAEIGLEKDRLPKFERFDFKLEVPPGIRFRGAHFRFELYDAIGRGAFGPEVGMIDVDCVAIGAAPAIVVADDEIIAYPIDWGQAGWRKVGPDLDRLLGKRPDATLWYGGEFLYGSASAFRKLADRFKEIWPVYTADPRSFAYVGQEMVLTALLHGTPGIRVRSAHDEKIILRWWSHRTVGRQESFEKARRFAILHMPGDKPFLARFADAPFDASDFLRRYEWHLRGRILASHLSNWTAWFNRGGVKEVPRLR